jgi:hypothetical protein
VWSPDGQKIVFVSYRDGNANVYVMNADGTSQTALTNDPATDFGGIWSYDGSKIAFWSERDGNREIYVMDADGSNQTRVTNHPASDTGPVWSPDGTRLAFNHSDFSLQPPDRGDVYSINVDGSGLTLLTGGPQDATADYGPSWSPDGAKIAFHAQTTGVAIWVMNADGSGEQDILPHEGFGHTFRGFAPVGSRVLLNWNDNVFTANRDGSDRQQLTAGDPPEVNASWSPDATHIIATSSVCPDDERLPCDPARLAVMQSDGTGVADVGEGFQPNWQPIPVNAYPRPKGASPMQTSLVPAYQPCASPNRTHGPPLAFPSCAPPQRTPGQLTIGTADSNGRPTKSVSIIQIGVRPGIPSTTTVDEADLRLFGTVNDVRLASDLSDYTGNLEARMSLRITDKDNTPHPGGPGAGTTQDLTYSFPIPCSATSDTTVGGDCTFETTAEAFAPGLVKELRRSIWELGSMRVYDGSGGLFMTQGIFVP